MAFLRRFTIRSNWVNQLSEATFASDANALHSPLNRPKLILNFIALLSASVRVCADGGGNRLLSTFRTEVYDGRLPLPNAIVGDLDSLSIKARSWYAQRGVEIAFRPGQYATDLQKSIQWVEDWENEGGNQLRRDLPMGQLELVIFGGLGGRLDQTAHTLHVLWKLTPGLAAAGGYEDPDLDIENASRKRGGQVEKRRRTYVVGDGSLVFLLPPGGHRLFHPRPILGEACGILPFGVQSNVGEDPSQRTGANVTTRGLEWDVTPDTPQSIGGYLSTSNHVVGIQDGQSSDVSTSLLVEVVTDEPIYWSVELTSSGPSESDAE